jgi:hypothetical protein
MSAPVLNRPLARISRRGSVHRARQRVARACEATTRGRVPSGRSIVRPDARWRDAVHAELFCRVQIGLAKMHRFFERKIRKTAITVKYPG